MTFKRRSRRRDRPEPAGRVRGRRTGRATGRRDAVPGSLREHGTPCSVLCSSEHHHVVLRISFVIYTREPIDTTRTRS